MWCIVTIAFASFPSGCDDLAPAHSIENATVVDRRYNRRALVLLVVHSLEGNPKITHKGSIFALTRFLVRLPQQ